MGFTTDESIATELETYIVNDGTLYRQRVTPMITNLAKKMAKGTYNRTQAVKLWRYLADDGAKKYNKEFGLGSRGYGPWTPAIRNIVAKELRDYYEENVEDEAADIKAKRKKNPTRRRNKGHDWIQGVDREIEEDHTEGAFTKQARRAGYSNTMEFARKVMAGWRSGRKKVYNKREQRYQNITKKTMYRANFAINVQKNPSRRKNSRAQRKALGKRMYLQISPSAARKRTWGTGNERKYNEKLADLAGQIVEVDTKYLFEDQYNLKDHDLRVFDRDVVEVINDQRKGMQKSHWSGKWGPARGKGADDFLAAEIDAMAGSRYAKPEDIYAMQTGRMRKKFKAPKKSPVPTYMRGWTATKVAKVFKNGNVLLDNGTRLVKALGKYDGNNSKPRIGQKVYRNSGGTHFWVKEFPDRYDPEDRRVLVRVPRKGGGKYHSVRPISRATGISEKKLLSMSIPQFVFAASKARL